MQRRQFLGVVGQFRFEAHVLLMRLTAEPWRPSSHLRIHNYDQRINKQLRGLYFFVYT